MGCWSGEEGEGEKLRLFMTLYVLHTSYGRREHIVGCAHNRATKAGSRQPSQSSRTFNQQQQLVPQADVCVRARIAIPHIGKHK